MKRRRLAFIIAVLFSQLVIATWVTANPSHKASDAALAVHGKEFSPELSETAFKLYDGAKQKLEKLIEVEKKSVQKLDAEDLGVTHLTVTRMRRAAQQLQILGEPAGRDFEMRGTMMHSHVLRLIGQCKGTPNGQKYITNVRQFIAKTEEARSKAVSNIEKLIAQRKWETAEGEFFKVYDALEPRTVFLTVEENQAIYTQRWVNADIAIRGAMLEIRSTKAGEILTKAVQDLTPNYTAILQEINDPITQVGTEGTATWNNESVTGPQLVERIGQRWRETQVAALQARGKYWALIHRAHASRADAAAAFSTGDPQSQDKFAAEFAAFSGKVAKSFSRLIDSDAKRASPEMAPQLYSEYLRALAPLVRQSNSRPFADQIEGALAAFLTKNPTLGNEVKAYRAATDEILLWRARVAQSAASVHIASFAPIEKRMYEGTVSGNGYLGLFPEQGGTIPVLLASAPDVMSTAITRLMGQQATVRDAIRLPGESKAAIARFTARTYANTPAPLPLTPEVDALKLDLLVSEKAPPLTLAATQAVLTAERGDMLAIGGEISGTYLESVIARFAALPNSAAVLTTLGQLPTEQGSGTDLNNMLMRFDITPKWVMHDYFWINLATPANTTAGK